MSDLILQEGRWYWIAGGGPFRLDQILRTPMITLACSTLSGSQYWARRHELLPLTREAFERFVEESTVRNIAPDPEGVAAVRAWFEARLWDEYGTPTKPHVACPTCHEPDEVGSNYDNAWCCSCGWRGSLTEMRKETSNVL